MFTSCTKEDIIEEEKITIVLNQSVSGNAFLDSDGDGVAETPMFGGRVYFGFGPHVAEIIPMRPDTLDAPYNEIYWAEVQLDGSYEILGVEEGAMGSIFLIYPEPTINLRGKDYTLDGDPFEDQLFSDISCIVELDEHDDGNNFTADLNVIEGSISGNITIDNDKDGIIDGPEEGVKLWLSNSNGSGNPIGLAIDNTYTDANGNYAFYAVPDGEYVVSFGSNVEYSVTSSGDASPDGDLPGPLKEFIPVDLINDEHDADNNFEIVPRWYNITGYVLEDLDNDGIADQPVYQYKVEVYNRDSDGNPVGASVGWSPSGPDGYYKFLNLPVGEYVVLLTEFSDYQCVSGKDETPEAGEPQVNPSCSLIQADVLFQDSEDDDNVFIVEVI